MAAETFIEYSEGKTAKQAFDKAVKQARYNYGHEGYTGTIAEKDNFIMIDCNHKDEKDIIKFIEKLFDDQDHRINDKWGPAGCIKLKENTFIFFGWASS